MALAEQVRLALEQNPKATAEEIAVLIGESVRRTKAAIFLFGPKKKQKAK
jgi:hypothetical protein